MKDKKTFGAFIREKRINKNYSQKDLAELLYVTESAVSKWERGVTYPDITLITDICKVLEISEKELIQSGDDTEYRRIKDNSDRFNRIKKTLFWTLNICYLVSIVVCFIVNLSVNHTLSWFFIVLSSIFVAYTFCPTIIWIYQKFKNLIFIGSTFISLFLLFLTCSIYTQNYWFMIPTISVLLGYFIIFYPLLFRKQKKYMNEEKSKKLSKWFLLTYSSIILILILFLLISIYCYIPFNIGLGVIITFGCMLLPIIIGIILALNINKNIIKMITLSLVGLVVIVFIVGISRAIYLSSTVENKEHRIEKSFNKINIDIQTEDINIYFTDDASKVVYVKNQNITLDIKTKNDALFISQIDNSKFYDQIFNFTAFKMNLYLNKEVIDSLNINCRTGDILIHEGFTFSSVNIKNSTGDIIVKSNVKNDLSIENSTGNIKIINCDNVGRMNINTKTGNLDLLNINCEKLDIKISTGDTKLTNTLVKNDFNMEGKTGNLYLDGVDAANININCSTGDVKGTILSSKFFIAKSDTGYVSVPETREGGECRINVSTGNIIITYK